MSKLCRGCLFVWLIELISLVLQVGQQGRIDLLPDRVTTAAAVVEPKSALKSSNGRPAELLPRHIRDEPLDSASTGYVRRYFLVYLFDLHVSASGSFGQLSTVCAPLLSSAHLWCARL